MAGWHHENIQSKVKEITVKGAFDIQEEARDKAREKGLYAYESADELLADPQIDLVTIAVPNDFHKNYAIRALRAGKNVVCEKPVTLNSKELEEIIAVSKETGKLFSVHQNRRWDKDYRIVKKLIDEGTIGKPYYIESRVEGSRRALHGWRGHKINGGGMLLDWGVHLLDQAMMLIDSPVVSVFAHMQSIYCTEVDDNFKGMIRFENGVNYLIEVATNCFINLPRWHVSAKDGTVVVEDWACNGRVVTCDTGAKMEWADDIVYTEAGPTRTMAPRPPETTIQSPLPDVHTDWTEYYQNIAATLDGKATLLVKPEQALRVMKVIDALFESDAKGAGVSVHI
jgi:predicted dehydrogenase